MPTIIALVHVLMQGLGLTLCLTTGSALLATPTALLAGIARLSGHAWLRWPATFYIEIFRGTSALVQLFWFYFVLPLFGLTLSAITASVVVLGLNAGAYGGEIVRGSLQALPEGQRQAATALNMGPYQALWRIYLPQAVPTMLPSFGNLLVELLKNTALASLVTLDELTFKAQLLRAQTLHSAGIFTIILLLYFAVALVISTGVRALERWISHRQGAARNADI